MRVKPVVDEPTLCRGPLTVQTNRVTIDASLGDRERQLPRL
jgi:hypothetical protein